MSEPKSKEEYLQRFMFNQHYTGFGLATTQHMPCPFCGAAEWMAVRIIDVEAEMQHDTMCKECGRSARAIVERSGVHNIRFEFVQTGGPDQPEWLEPKMRRVS